MSCSIDEYYAQYDEAMKHALEDIKCSACAETIQSGQIYTLVAIWRQEDATEDGDGEGYEAGNESDDGLFLTDEPSETLNRCARCQAIHVHLRDLGQEMWPDEQLNCGEEYEEHWGKEPPPEIAALAFALPGEVKL